MRPCLLLGLLALAANSALAEVSESLDYRYYTAAPRPNESLLSALNHASPIRENGRTFHGYTKWHVSWRFRWHQEPSGRCAITSTHTEVSGLIDLPQLKGGTTAQKAAFERYIPALREHELGHYRIGRDAAVQIDHEILRLPPMHNCQALEQAANDGAHRTLARFQQQERDYDARTGHGRTQGAWLKQ